MDTSALGWPEELLECQNVFFKTDVSYRDQNRNPKTFCFEPVRCFSALCLHWHRRWVRLSSLSTWICVLLCARTTFPEAMLSLAKSFSWHVAKWVCFHTSTTEQTSPVFLFSFFFFFVNVFTLAGNTAEAVFGGVFYFCFMPEGRSGKMINALSTTLAICRSQKYRGLLGLVPVLEEYTHWWFGNFSFFSASA